MRTNIVVSRQWNNPKIEAFVSSDAIGSRMEVNEFLDSLVEHLGNPTFVVTKQSLKTRLEAAAIEVLAEMRSATKHVL